MHRFNWSSFKWRVISLVMNLFPVALFADLAPLRQPPGNQFPAELKTAAAIYCGGALLVSCSSLFLLWNLEKSRCQGTAEKNQKEPIWKFFAFLFLVGMLLSSGFSFLATGYVLTYGKLF